jgi:hypothetical protein
MEENPVTRGVSIELLFDGNEDCRRLWSALLVQGCRYEILTDVFHIETSGDQDGKPTPGDWFNQNFPSRDRGRDLRQK